MRFKPKIYFLALSLLPLLFVLRVPALTEQTQMVSHGLMRPFLLAGSGLSQTVSNLGDYFLLFWHTVDRLEQQQIEVAALHSKLAGFDETLRENQRLRKLLEFREKQDYETIGARVIGWDLSPWQKSVILGKGEKDGLARDMTVVVPEGLVGRIVDVGPHTVRVLLLIDPSARVSALSAESRSQGIVSGDGSPVLRMRFLPLDSGVAVEERVVTSGLTGLFPKGLPIGTVESVVKDKDGLHLVADVMPVVAFTRIEEVLCIVSSAGK